MQALFGVFLLSYIPNLDAYMGHIPLQTDPHDDIKYEVLHGGEHICPERHANIFSSKTLFIFLDKVRLVKTEGKICKKEVHVIRNLRSKQVSKTRYFY